MLEWLKEYWWLVWAAIAGPGLIALNVRARGGDESLPRRVLYALVWRTDPRNRPRRDMSALSIVLIVVGVAAALLLQRILSFL